jgi:hypothetical protein
MPGRYKIEALILSSRPGPMTPLLYFVSIFSLVALFASAIIGTFWALGRFLEALLTPPSVRKRRREAAAGLNAHHLKRAGQ